VIKVLVVDDSALVRKLFGRVLSEDSGFEVGFARDGLEALSLLQEFRPDVITLDVNMPHMNGLDCLDRIMVQRPCPVVMVSTATADGAEATLNALRLGAVDFVAKPGGAVSLRIEEFAPVLKEKIRAAAAAKLPSTWRLKERVQFKVGGSLTPSPAGIGAETTEPAVEAAQGSGLVLVGTSTGGPPALEALLVPLASTFAWPILIAQHMPASFTASLARRLDGICAVSVVEVRQPTSLRAGCVYIGRGDADIVVSKRGSSLVAMSVPSDEKYPWHPSADRLVRSAMEHVLPPQLIGILMTGMGSDGALAMSELRSKGGRTIAEAQETAVVWGMPGELVRANGATWTVPLPRIAQRLQKLVP
jgi:two-component system chemotaxis response regulator CheB